MKKISNLFVLAVLALTPVLSYAQTFEPEPPASTEHPAPPRPAISRLSDDDRETLENGPISQGRYIAGGVVATVAGFGIGHAIEGRYFPLGFIYSVGEAGSVGLIVAGASSCFNQNSSFMTNHDISTCENSAALVTAGVVLLVGLHIWETIDAWVAPNSINKHYQEVKKRTGLSSAQLVPMPVSGRDGGPIDGGKLALQFSF